MMRHSKTQTLADGSGKQVAIISLPPITTTVVQLDLAPGSETAVYKAIEAFVQGRIAVYMTKANPMAYFLQVKI